MLINEMNANGSDDDNNGSILATSAADSEKTVNFEVLKGESGHIYLIFVLFLQVYSGISQVNE